MADEPPIGVGDAEGRERPGLLGAGARAKGEFQCAGCGYGVIVHTKLPRCPMCGLASWQRTPWSSLSRALVR
jgi:rubrerythrin